MMLLMKWKRFASIKFSFHLMKSSEFKALLTIWKKSALLNSAIHLVMSIVC